MKTKNKKGIISKNKSIIQTIILFVFLVVILLLSGCTQKTIEEKRIGDGDYKTGTQGIEISFDKSYFPKEVYEQENFVIGFKIANNGAYDVSKEDSVLTIGAEREYVSFLEDGGWEDSLNIRKGEKLNTFSYALKGKSVAYPKGESDIGFIVFYAKNNEGQSSHTSAITLNTCYKYSSNVSQSVCIDSDPLNLKNAPKSCVIKPIVLSSQGGPVAITGIETRISSSGEYIEPIFTIHIQNKGSGMIINPNKIKECCGIESPDNQNKFTREDFNTLEINAFLEDIKLDCTPYPLTITKNRDFVTCSLKEKSDLPSSVYSSFLKISLSYGYQYSVSGSFTIKSRFS